MRQRRNILAVAIGVVSAIGLAIYAGARYAATACSISENTEPGSEWSRLCETWFLAHDPIVWAAAVAAVAALIAGVAVLLRRPELLVILAALGFIPAGVPEAKLQAADTDAPERVEIARDHLGTPITAQPDKPLVPAPPSPLRTETGRLDEDAQMASVNFLKVVGECIVKSHSQPRRCEHPSFWGTSGIATDARISVTVRDRDYYRVDATSAAPANPPVVYSAIFDERRKRIVYACTPAPSERCGEGRAEEKLPPG